jgi:drug/metabolite transporter (DMT)-like permease
MMVFAFCDGLSQGMLPLVGYNFSAHWNEGHLNSFSSWEKTYRSWWREQTMIGVVFALLAAFAYGLSAVLIRKKLDESNYFSATMMVTVTGNIILWRLRFYSQI